jgi:phosphoribosylanthranilate isomerase
LKIKVCGLTTPSDVGPCLEAGIDWVGLNFHPGSPRRVHPATVGAILEALQGRANPVGLFVDRPPAEIRDLARGLGLGLVQLHGQEPPEDLVALGDFFLIKAFRLADEASAGAIHAYLDRADRLGRVPDAILIDAYVPGQAGGTGVAIPDDLLSLIPAHPRVILAGGLTAANVADRVRRVSPWMVDVASGVEWMPGRKDPNKVASFALAARLASPRPAP